MAGIDLTGHGGRLNSARLAYPGAPQPWLDLSTGINPIPYPAPRASAEARARLPDPVEIRALEAAAAAAFGVDDPARVAATPGSEAALRLLPSILDGEGVSLLSPTYASHAQAWRQRHPSEAANLESAEPGAAILVLARPNNPDGAIARRDALLSEVARRRWVVLDEAFVEAQPQISLAPVAGAGAQSGLVVLRSFGKFYGLAGLRLGFVVAAPAVAAAVRGLFGDWPVCAEAIAAGLSAYPDTAWASAARARLARDAARLDRLLVAAGLRVIGGASLFRLAEAEDAPARFERLARAGVLARPFADQPRRLRFGLPGSDADFDRLAAALGS